MFRPEVFVNELDIIVEPDDSATGERLDVFLRDVARFIVEETMGVAAPCYATHVDPGLG